MKLRNLRLIIKYIGENLIVWDSGDFPSAPDGSIVKFIDVTTNIFRYYIMNLHFVYTTFVSGNSLNNTNYITEPYDLIHSVHLDVSRLYIFNFKQCIK